MFSFKSPVSRATKKKYQKEKRWYIGENKHNWSSIIHARNLACNRYSHDEWTNQNFIVRNNLFIDWWFDKCIFVKDTLPFQNQSFSDKIRLKKKKKEKNTNLNRIFTSDYSRSETLSRAARNDSKLKLQLKNIIVELISLNRGSFVHAHRAYMSFTACTNLRSVHCYSQCFSNAPAVSQQFRKFRRSFKEEKRKKSLPSKWNNLVQYFRREAKAYSLKNTDSGHDCRRNPPTPKARFL